IIIQLTNSERKINETFIFDQFGNVLSERYFNPDYNIDDIWTYTYKYDANGNWILRNETGPYHAQIQRKIFYSK
ncbi:MAG: hypothetical protein AAGK97_15250, partial [Bacteroidota bacterium]